MPVVNRCPAIFGKGQQLDQNLTKILVKLLWRSPFRNEAFWLFGSFVFRNTSGWLLLLQPVNLRNLNFFGAIFKNSSKWLPHQLKLVTSTYPSDYPSDLSYTATCPSDQSSSIFSTFHENLLLYWLSPLRIWIIRILIHTLWTRYVNWTYIWRSGDVKDIFSTFYVYSIYVLCPGGKYKNYKRIKQPYNVYFFITARILITSPFLISSPQLYSGAIEWMNSLF